MTPLLSDNFSQFSTFNLVDKDRIILDDESAKPFDTFLINAVGNLNIKDVMNSPGVNGTSPRASVDIHCVKSVRVLSFSGPYFPALRLNSDSLSFRIQCECGKIRTRETPNTDTFHAVTRILNYRDHPSLKLIWENVSFVNSLIITETDIKENF